MRIAASGLVVVSALSLSLPFALGCGCGDKKREGLPPAADWQPPPGSGAAGPVAVEMPEEILARCAARAFVDDAARDGNMPEDVLDDLASVPDAGAVVLLRALAAAAARLPNAEQQAMLLGGVGLRLAQRGDVEGARTPLRRALALLDRPATNDMQRQLASMSVARAGGRLADPDAMARFGGDPTLAPYLARGLAEAGHAELADQTLARIATFDRLDPFGAAEIAITLLARGRFDEARARAAAAPVDQRVLGSLLLATAAVDARHPQARALVDDAARLMDADETVPSAEIDLARIQLAVGDAPGSAARRVRLRTAIAAEPDADRARMTLYNLHVLATRAGAADEAAALLGDLEARSAAPWMLALARGQSLAVTGKVKEAIAEVERIPADGAPPRGVIFVDALASYLAAARDPELERWLTAHICDGIE